MYSLWDSKSAGWGWGLRAGLLLSTLCVYRVLAVMFCVEANLVCSCAVHSRRSIWLGGRISRIAYVFSCLFSLVHISRIIYLSTTRRNCASAFHYL